MKNTNYPLLIGGIIVILLVIVASYPQIFTSTDPLFKENSKYIQYKENGEWVENYATPPYRPNKENIMGSDDDGRDLYARLVYGTRNTLKLGLLIALFRMLLALPLGLAAGMGGKLISNTIKVFNTFFTAIPMLLFSFIVLNIDYFSSLEINQAILAFAIVLTFVGWGKLAGMIEDSTKRIMEEDFIEGEIAIGKSRIQIAYQNVIPHLIPTCISLFFKEIAMALFLVVQLAVLYVFVGAKKEIQNEISRIPEVSVEPEWGAHLSRLQYNIRRYKIAYWEYWLTVYPVLVFSIAIVGVNLTGEGLRIEFEKRESRVISFIRKSFYALSPKLFVGQIKDFKRNYKPVMAKVLILLMIVAYINIPWHPSKYQFDLDYAKIHLQELTKEEYGGRVTGTEGNYLAGEYIINTLKEYGYQVDTMEFPLTYEDENGEILLEDLSPISIESGWIKVKNDKGEEKIYQLHKDFTIFTLSQKAMMDAHEDEIYFKGVVVGPENKDKILEGTDGFEVDWNNYRVVNQPYAYSVQNVMKNDQNPNYDLKFLLSEELCGNVNTYLYNTTSIVPFDELRKDIQNGIGDIEISLDYPKLPKYPVRSITAFLPGQDKTQEDPGELIIIGTSYDGIQINGADNPYGMSATPAATALEVARKLSLMEEPLEKSVQFIFWDNEFDMAKYSVLDASYYYLKTDRKPMDMAMTHRYYYLNISLPGFKGDGPLKLITLPGQIPDKNAYLMGGEISKRLKQLDVKHRRVQERSNTKAIKNLVNNSLGSVGIGFESMWGINSSMDTIENINYKQMKNIGQIILDTLTMNPYLMD